MWVKTKKKEQEKTNQKGNTIKLTVCTDSHTNTDICIHHSVKLNCTK